MSLNPTRRPSSTNQKRQRFLEHLWSLLTGTQTRTRIRSQRLGRVETLEERRVLATMYAVDDANNVVTFDSATPGTIANNVAITGLNAGELVVGIDTRPATGQLYGLGLVDDGATRTGRIYTIDPTTGAATQVGAAPWSTTLADVQFTGFNFNPNVDRIRVTNRVGGNFRVHPDTGALVSTDTDLSQVGINGVSYTNNDGSLPTTTLYGLIFDTDEFATIGGLNGSPSPNGGLVTTIGATGIVALDSYAVEITNLGGATNAFVTANGELYTANLTTGALTLAGAIGAGTSQFLGLTAALNTIAVAGSGADDTLVVNATGPSGGTYSLNGGPAVPFANIASFSFIGGAGNDTLTINNPAGGLFAPVRGIDYQGGGQAGDTLNLLGGGSAAFNETYFVGTTTPPIGAGAGNNGDGLLRFTGPTPVDIRFKGLAPIVDTVAVANLTVNATDASNVISVTDGSTAPRLKITVDAFESIEFNNKAVVIVNADDGVAGGDAADTITVNQSNFPAALTNLSINAQGGDNTITVLAVAGPYSLFLNGGSNNDLIDASVTLPSAVTIQLIGNDGDDTLIGGADDDIFDGGGGNDTFTGNGGNDNIGSGFPVSTGDRILVAGTPGADTITLAATGGSLITTVNGVTTTYRNFVGGAISASGIDLVLVDSHAGSDTVTVNSTDAAFPTNISTGAGDDSIALGNGVTLNGGTIDGGADSDTIDYSAYTSTVAVNLGSNAPLLIGTVEGAQENPAQNTTAGGTVTLNYNNVAKTYDIHAQISNLAPNLVTGFHIHRAPVGVNGPIIVDLAAIFGLGSLIADGSGGFTFDAVGVSLPVQHEAAFLGGLTYFNVHTAAAPGGLIRGQIVVNGNFVPATATATGTAGIVGVENAIGGSGADSLVGSPTANTLRGNAGNDTIVGALGADIVDGGDNSDSITWSNGDGSDIFDGGTGADIVQVNGSIPLGDNFTVGANGARVAFARTNLGLFSLDIGTTETLIVSGNGGDDITTVNSLAGVADLTALNLAGLNGNDTFNTAFQPSITVNVNGGSHTTGDTLNVDATGGTVSDSGTQLTKVGSSPINYSQIENLANENAGDLTIVGTAGDDTLVVNATGTDAGTYRLNAGPTIAFSGLTKFTFNSLGGGDTLTINNPASGLFAPTGGVDYNGGGQAGDALNLLGGGGGGISETYFVGTTTPPVNAGGNNGDGLVRFTGTSAVDIRFTGLAPIIDTVAVASLTVVSTDAANTISLTNGTVSPRLKVTVDAFEPIEFDNKNTLTINAGDGTVGGDIADTIDVDFTNTPAALSQINVNGDEGDDVINVKAKAGPTFSVFGNDGLNRINVGKAGTLDGLLGGQLVFFGNPATFTDIVNINDNADLNSNTYIFNNNFFVRSGTTTFGWSGNVGQVTLSAGLGNDVINASGGFTNVLTTVNAGGGDDLINVGFNNTLNFVAGPLTIAGEAGANDRVVLDDSANNVASTINVTATNATRVGRGTITYGTVEGLTVLSGTLADVINLNSTSVPTSISTGAGDDSIVFANGVSLNGGTIDGGANTDTIDYSAYSTTVAVNLGSNAPGLSGTVEGAQENPAQNTTAGGSVTLTYNNVAKTYDIHAQISNLAPNLVTGFHIHRAQVGVNGPIIVDLAAIFGLGSLVADGLGGFTFDAVGVPLPTQHEAAFLGGLTYFNVHTAAAPGGLIRGQIIANGAFVAAPGTATGTAGIFGIENALGGTGVDSLVGDAGVNILRGNAGNDTIIGAQANDTLDGGDNNDSITWSNGDGTDVIEGGLGADLVQVNGSVTAGDTFTVGANGSRVAFARTNPGPFALDIGTTETLIVNGAGGDDNTTVNSLAGVADLTAVNLAGLTGNDTFNTGFASSPVVINVNGGSHTTGDTLNVDAAGGLVTDSGTQLSKVGFSPINYQQIENLSVTNTGDITITGTGLDDTLVINATSANAGTYRLNVGPVNAFSGVTKLTFNGLAGSDTLTINNPSGSLFAPTGGIDYNGGGQAGDSLNLLGGGGPGINETYFVGTTTPPVGAGGNNGDGLIRFTGSSTVDIRFTGLAPIVDTVVVASLTVNSTDAANAINVTNAAVAPRLRVAVDAFEPIDFDNKAVVIVNAGDGFAGGDAADTINVNFTNVPAALTSLTVNADEGSDDINLTVAGNVGVPLLISGGLANGNSGQRDQLNITDNSAGRAVAFDYQNGSNGDVNVNGIGAVVSVRQIESLVYSGNNATVSVDGTSGTDDITVASALGAAMIFLGGNPWDGPIDGAFGSVLPGAAGPGANKGPDIFARGLNQFSSVGVTGGGGTNDQLYLYGSSENDILDPANAAQPVFRGVGLGNGVLIPGRGVGNAFDNISILPNQVFINTTGGNALIGVNMPNPGDFAQTNPLNPGLIVNAGDEAAPAANGIADSISAQLSSVFRLQVNGGNPPVAGAPAGDQMQIFTPGTAQVYSDKIPNVTVTSPGVLGIGFTSIEQTLVTTGNGIVQLIGDNNDPTVEQTDNFIVEGQDVDSLLLEGDADGVGEFSLRINGDSVAPNAPQLFFNRVQFLSVFGADLTGVDAGQIDTLDITPYADNTPRGWGIATFFDEDAPAGADGNQADLLIIHTSSFGGPVSEDIILQPSELDAGEVVIKNHSFGTPIANISYIANTDIIVIDDDLSTTDTDTLTVRGNNADQANGLTGNNTFNADFTAAGDAANPIVTVFDGATQLFRLRTNPVAGAAPLTFNTINFETLGGNDTVNVVNRANGTLRVNVDGGLGNDTVAIRNTTAGATIYTPGSSTDSGSVATPNGTVQLLGTELVSLTGAVAGDALTANGTHDNDTIALQFLGGANRIWLNGQSVISFSSFGTINLNGRFGDDKINVLPVGLTGVTTINAVGGDPTASDEVVVSGTAGANNVVIDSLLIDGARVTGLGPVINVSTTERLVYSGLGGNDSLTLVGTVGNDVIVHSPGATDDAGTLVTNALLAVEYQSLGTIGSISVDGGGSNDTLVTEGTTNSDAIRVSAAGIVNVNNRLAITPVSIENLQLDALEGDDPVSIDTTFAGPITVVGSTGINTLRVDGVVAIPELFLVVPDATSGAGSITANTTINYSGISNAFLNGNRDDSLVILDTAQNNIWTVGTSPILGDRTQLDNRETVDYFGFNDVQLIATSGVDTFVVQPTGLNGSATPLVVFGGPVGSTDDRLVLQGTVGNDAFVLNSNNGGVGGAQGTASLNGTNVIFGDITSVELNGHAGNDSFDVTALANTSVLVDGGDPVGAAGDTLALTVPAVAGATTFVPGPVNDAGGFSFAGAVRPISFDNIEAVGPVNLAAAGGVLVVCGTNASDDINVQGSGAASVAVSVNGGPAANYTGVTSLSVQAKSGDDIIHVAPGVFTAPLNIDGGDPTASDKLIVSGTGASNAFTYNVSNTVGSGSVVIAGAGTVNFTTTESLVIDGQGGTDAVTVASPSGHRTTVTPGSAADSGTISSQALGLGPASVPLSYSHIGATGTVTIAGSGDIVEFNGTANSDTFNVTGSTAQIVNATFGNVTVGFNLTNIFSLELRGLDGDDRFIITGSLAAYTSGVVVDGGNPSASDVLNLSSPTGAVAVNLASNTVTGYGATVTMIGVETLNANAANGNLTVNGTAGDDSLEVTPTGANSATLRLTKSSPAIGSTPVVNGAQIGTLSVDLQGGSDVLSVFGTTAGEAISVTGVLVTVGTLEAVNYAGTEALSVFAQQGADTITVTPGAIPIFIDGGDPIGVLPGDQLIVNAAVGFFAGPESDEGGVATGGGTVSFDHIESLTVAAIAGCPFLVLGTNADDDITVIARDASTTAGADGVQDFTFSVNAGMDIVVLNQAELFIDAMAGDDDIVIRTAAPNEAAWDVNVHVAGGSPSIGAPLEADRLVLETPNNAGGSDDVVFSPSGADTGNLLIDKNANGTYDAGGTDSLITFGSFVFNCPPAAFTYTSTAGGVELIQYNGEGAPAVDDNLTINGTGLDDTTILSPTGIGTGSFASGASPQFIFQSFDSVTINSGTGGFDRVQINGTEGVDVVTSNANTVTLGSAVTIGTGIDQLDINTFGGNDSVDLDLAVTGLAKFVNVGSGNDVVNLLGVAVDAADPTIYGGDGDDIIFGSPNPDSIFGGTGNDILVGGGAIDQIYGEEGNDILGNPSAAANGVADDAGNDFFNGGAGSDTFVWEPGDGSDTIEGGAGDADVLAFFGGAGAEVFNVFAKLSDPSRAILFRNTGNITIDMAGIDQINVQGNAGADAYVVGRANNGDSGSAVAPTSPYTDPTASLSDLSTTEVRVVNIIEATDAPDNVFVDGRPTDDNLTVSVESAATGVLRVAGLPYAVRVSGSNTADRLTIRGNEGSDTIKSINSSNATVEGLIGITFAGGAGNDTLSADAILIGGSGDDYLEGGAGADQLFGNDGEDTMVGGAGADTFDGGAGFDTILVRGTLGNDSIVVNQAFPTALFSVLNGVPDPDSLVLDGVTRTVERVLVDAKDGNDLVTASWADSLGTDGALNSLRIDVDGGAGSTSDRVGIIDDGTGDLVLMEKGTHDDSGQVSIGPGNTEPLVLVYDNVEIVQPVIGTGGDVVVFKHDPFEYNDLRSLATYLGANSAINVDPVINPGEVPHFLPADEDWFRVVAETTGVLDFQVYFRQVGPVASGRPGLPNSGNLDIAVTDAAGNVIAGFGVNDATSDERVRIPSVAGQTYYLRVFANGAAINTYNVTVDNYAPPTPRDMELLDNPVGDPPAANSDTGRSQFDNVTRDNTPTLVFRLDDGILLNDIQGNSPAGNNPPNGVVIPIPFQAAAGTAGYRVAIFDEGPLPIAGTTAPQTPLGFATFVSPGVYQFTTPVLADGSHFLTARVQMVDPATAQQTGFGERSVALEVVIDTVIPTGFFGQVSLADTAQGLDAASDSGVVGDSTTFVDRVTHDTTPSFYGRAEANAIVRVYAETNGVAGLQSTGAGADLFLGLTVTAPLDGTNQFPGGQWSFTTPLDLNNPNLGFAHDGARSIYVTSEDLAGNVTTDAAADRLNIFLDTAGAQVTDVQITGSPLYNLFGLKPDNSIEGPTPRVDSLTVRVQDFANRSNVDPNFLYAALQQAVATIPGSFVLKGDHTGLIAIQSITFIGDPTGNGAIATASILLNFFAPLPDDRYTLTINENVVDPAGNKLDGESNAAEPIGNPNFASGDGQPGVDFVARFTVDSRPEIGTISEGLVYVDINGNMVWDPEGQDNDATNRDFTFQFGQLVDSHFSGNFAPTGAAAASGFDKLGAYGKFAGKYSFILDTNDDGVGDFSSLMPAAYQVNGNPVAGDFNAAHPGDEIGLFDGTFWYLDTNGNNQIDLGERFASNFNGLPVVGDFNGDGNDDLAVFVNDTNRFIFDTNRDGNSDFTWNVADQLGRFGGLSGFTDRPVAGDLNLDGIDDIGLWAKDRQGTLPRNSGEYFFWVSDRVNANPANVFDSFSPAPLGNDLSAQFGDELALPVFGNFDPPVTTSTVDSNPLHRIPAPLDINGDGAISPIDALLVINVLNNFPGLPTNDPVRAYFTIGQVKADASGDRGVSPIDALLVINALNRKSNVGGEGEGEGEMSADVAGVAQYQAAADDFFAQLGDNSDLENLKKRRS